MDFLFGTEPIRWIQRFFGPGHPLPFHLLSMLGDTWGIIFVVGIGFWLYGREPLYALVLMAAFTAGSWLLVSQLFDVSRPEGPGIIVYEHLEVGAFPSGHLSQAVAAWGLLYALGHVPLGVPIMVALLTGLGRMYLGTHFLADVIGGALYGALLVAVFAPVWRRTRGWLAERSFELYVGLAGVALAGGLFWLSRIPDEGRRVEIVGMLIAATLALPAEYRWLRYSPGRPGRDRQALMVLIGLAGLAPLVIVDRMLGAEAPLLGAASAALAVVWAVLAAPALFRALGRAKKEG